MYQNDQEFQERFLEYCKAHPKMIRDLFIALSFRRKYNIGNDCQWFRFFGHSVDSEISWKCQMSICVPIKGVLKVWQITEPI